MSGRLSKFGSAIIGLLLASCQSYSAENSQIAQAAPPPAAEGNYLAQPLISEIYTADPSAHVWNDGRIYIYPSHDIETGVAEDGAGNHFAMRDYRVLSMYKVGGKVTLHDVALDIKDVPWAGRQMWAPDAAYKDGSYYLYSPVKDKSGIFRLGVATSKSPTGPFKAQPQPMKGSYSIDPAVFRDDDGAHYIYFGGIWGGQLQKWATGSYDPNGSESDLGQPGAPAIAPKIARLRGDMLEFDEAPRDILITDEAGKPLLGGDLDRRFFEGAWVFKRDGLYYFTYSTGETHYLVYATGTSPYGPFTYRGTILEPVEGWTTHHSITQHDGQWYLFYHDTQLSGKTHLRNVKVAPLEFDENGQIRTLDPGGK
ncbi:glycoside hydrolase family 43 protein [Sphingorhabdus arenilitoris]|uniref:Glycoside hydrolase family 43 protein n=1 Tax=Sphingorhabdus arenilitoris TaxID=1490041 RepID=A0ABV8RGL0_9SPHN